MKSQPQMIVGSVPPHRRNESQIENESYDVLYKIVIIGDTAVGKSNLLAQYTSDIDANNFDPNLRPTVGAEFGTKTLKHPDGTVIRVRIWDTAGQERYRCITKSHYRRAAGAVIMYDVTNPKSLHSAKDYWIGEVNNAADRDSTLNDCVMLVGNKIDLISAISEKKHKATANEMGVLLEGMTSAKTSQNVTAVLDKLVFAIYESDVRRGTFTRKDQPSVSLSEPDVCMNPSVSCC